MSPVVSSDDGTVPPNYPVTTFLKLIDSIFAAEYGFDIFHVESLPDVLASTGFTNVQRRIFKLPIGGWPKDGHLNMIGHCFRMVLLDFCSAAAAKPFPQAGFDKSDTQALLDEMEKATANRHIHAYLQVHFVWAQKPLL